MMRNTAFRAQSRMRGLIVAPLLAGVACFALPAWAGSAAQPAGSELVSAGVNGVSTGGASSGVPLDGDGSVIAFHSDASQLVSGDTNQVRDVFVYDSTTDEVERISVASDGRAANRASHAAGGAPSLSADGQLVAFYSDATNLVDADVAGERNVYVHDRADGTTALITVGLGGEPANGPSLFPSMSADGRYVAFQSQASNLVADDTNGVADIFVYDRVDSVMQRACAVEGDKFSFSPALSDD